MGADLTVEQGYDAARETALLALRRILDEFGELERVERWVKVLGFVRSAPGFGDQPAVVNGFTETIVEVYGEERGTVRPERDRRLRAARGDSGRGRGRPGTTLAAWNGHVHHAQDPARARSPICGARRRSSHWDQQVMMPRGGRATAAPSSSRPSTGWRTSSSSPTRPAACSRAARSYEESLDPDSDDAALVRVTRLDYEKASRVPRRAARGDDARRVAGLPARGRSARARSDFERFLPGARAQRRAEAPLRRVLRPAPTSRTTSCSTTTSAG